LADNAAKRGLWGFVLLRANNLLMAGALSNQAEGGFLMLEYQKSSAAFSLTAQLLVSENFRAPSLLFAVWGRMDWAGNDFWYPSMRRPPNPSSPSELRKKPKKKPPTQRSTAF
jgi:hypothetical protein